MRARHWLFLFLTACTLLRWIYCAEAELSPDEAYYTLWSQRLDLAFFNHGPGVAVAIRAGTALFGANEFGVRFLGPLLALGTSLISFFFSRKLYGESVAVWTVVLLNAIPIFQAVWLTMTPDSLAIFFWAAALFTFWLALEKSGRGAPMGAAPVNRETKSPPAFTPWWPITGLLIGLGFLSKYTNAVEMLSVVLLLASRRKFRREFRRPGFWSMLAVFALCALPALIWNRRHEWIPLARIAHFGGALAGNPREEWLAFLEMHLLGCSPLIFAGMLAALWWSREKARTSFRAQFLLWFAAPSLVLNFLFAFGKSGGPYCTVPALVSLCILTVALWQDSEAANRGRQIFAVTAIGCGIAMCLVFLGADFFRAIGIPTPFWRDQFPLRHGWKTTARIVGEARSRQERALRHPVFLIADTAGTASELAFYLPDKRSEGPGHPPVYIPESQNIENQFAFWPRYDEFVVPAGKPGEPPPTTAEEESARAGVNPFLGRDALYITDRAGEDAPSSLRNGFERAELMGVYEIRHRGEPLRSIRVFACYNYRSLPL